jgi:hypothetical protein
MCNKRLKFYSKQICFRNPDSRPLLLDTRLSFWCQKEYAIYFLITDVYLGYSLCLESFQFVDLFPFPDLICISLIISCISVIKFYHFDDINYLTYGFDLSIFTSLGPLYYPSITMPNRCLEVSK